MYPFSEGNKPPYTSVPATQREWASKDRSMDGLCPLELGCKQSRTPKGMTAPHVGGHVPQIKGYMSPYMMLRQPLKGAD